MPWTQVGNIKGATGAQGVQGVAGAQGAPGVGVPTGGTSGQVLTKTSATDYATAWQTPTGGGAGGAASISVYEALAVTGSTVTLPSAPIASGMVGVYVNGQALMATRDYTLAGNVVTFTPALTADDVHVEYQTGGLSAAGYSGHYETTLSVGQSVITLPTTPSGVPHVTRGGVVQYQSAGHYSLAGTTLTLAAPIGAAEDGRISVDYVAGASTTPVNTTNLLTNGGFEVWQRGNGPFTANGAWGPDRWYVNLGGTSTMSVSKNTANADGGVGSCAAVAYTQGSGGSNLTQPMGGDMMYLAGRTVSFSARVRTSTANAVRLRIYDGAVHYSAYHSGSGNYDTLSLTVTFAAAPSTMWFDFDFQASGTFYLDNAMLVTGGIAADYIPMHPADELARCLRYYEAISTFALGNTWAGSNGVNYGQPFYFKVNKAVIPTVTIPAAGNWSLTNCGLPFTDTVGLLTMRIAQASTAAGVNMLAALNSGSITIEANP